MWSICHSLPQWMKLAQAPSHDLTFVTRYLTINYKWSQVIMWTRFTWWCLCVHILCALKFKNEPPHFSCVKRSVNPIYYGVCGENFWDTSHNICWKSPESDFACLENIFSFSQHQSSNVFFLYTLWTFKLPSCCHYVIISRTAAGSIGQRNLLSQPFFLRFSLVHQVRQSEKCWEFLFSHLFLILTSNSAVSELFHRLVMSTIFMRLCSFQCILQQGFKFYF